MTNKRLGGMKLSDFSTQSKDSDRSNTNEGSLATQTRAPKPTKSKKHKKQALSTINVEITRKQQRWLLDTAQEVRDNNEQAVPPQQRVYPKHLIGVAIDLLHAQDIDWTSIKNIDELRKQLILK